MKVVLAHGTFDVLHAGHVAHLEAARAMGDYLVVGITGDAYVQKGPGRPAVGAQDRARAVRALRCVDEVEIDNSPTPEKMIYRRMPQIFCKGADYAGQDLPEAAWVARYGGEVRFTAGDTMYHSRQWLNGDARAAMEQQGVTPADLLGVLDQAPAFRIHVVGDVIVDEYVQGELIGPLTLLAQDAQRWPGGASAVAKHVNAAGAKGYLSAPDRPTPRKTRYYSERGLLCQIDAVDSTPTSAVEVNALVGRLRAIPADAVIFADYRHGVFHAESLQPLRAAIPENALKVADSQVASRWGNILDFRGFDLVTPNEREARWALGRQDISARDTAMTLHAVWGFPQVLLTQGPEGLIGVDRDETVLTVPALATQAVDPVGAGDALLAYATLGLLAGQSLVTAAWLGSVAAAIACSRRGNSPVTAAEVREWLDRL